MQSLMLPNNFPFGKQTNRERLNHAVWLFLHRIYFNQCLLEFRINKRYVMHWKKIFNLLKYYNIRVHQCTPCFKVTRRTAQGEIAYQKKACQHVEIPVVNWKTSRISRGAKKNPHGISMMDLCFWYWNFQGVLNNFFCRISKWCKLVFFWNF